MAKKQTKDAAQRTREKQEILKRLSEKRVPKAVHAILLCKNLGKYSPSGGQVNAVLKALKDAVNSVEAAFASPTASTKPEFKLPS